MSAGLTLRRRSRTPFLVAVAIVGAAAGGRAADESPEAFARRVYARYAGNGPGVLMSRPQGEAFYAPSILAGRAAAEGSAGGLEADPLCDCQDYDDLKPISFRTLRAEATAATVEVRFVDGDRTGRATLTLVRSPGGWRIADVATPRAPSVAAALLEARRR